MESSFNELSNRENMLARAELNTAIVRRIYKLMKDEKITQEEANEAAKLLYVSSEYNNYKNRKSTWIQQL